MPSRCRGYANTRMEFCITSIGTNGHSLSRICSFRLVGAWPRCCEVVYMELKKEKKRCPTKRRAVCDTNANAIRDTKPRSKALTLLGQNENDNEGQNFAVKKSDVCLRAQKGRDVIASAKTESYLVRGAKLYGSEGWRTAETLIVSTGWERAAEIAAAVRRKRNGDDTKFVATNQCQNRAQRTRST